MTLNINKVREFVRHMIMTILVNIIIALLLVDAFFVDTPAGKLAAVVRIPLAFLVMTLAVNELRRIWKNIRHPGYYFLPSSAVFWLFENRRRRPKKESKTSRYEWIISTWPDTSIGIISELFNPERQEECLNKLLYQMHVMRDSRLATIADRFRHYLGDILKSVDDNENYQPFREIMSLFSSYGPEKYQQTYRRFLGLLSDVYDPSLSEYFDMQFQVDMSEPLKNAIGQAGKKHLCDFRRIVGNIMADDLDEHILANSIAGMLLELDWDNQREMCHIIFNESLKRAFRFPKHFGIELLSILSRLEHKIFWLDIQSLRNILEESLSNDREGLINLNSRMYGELCSKVLAPLDDETFNGICNARVFRRLTSDDGRVRIECVLPDGQVCTCHGESLSFRGIYSKNCSRKVGDKLKMNLFPIHQVKRPFAVKASIAPLHSYENATQSPGRGAFFEDAEPTVVRDLYEYISTK
ncbi:MAG: hypothetical protein JXA81_13080 [Sedimentisphaerales bacterium]|nr:hypothetical protein [Sedimentisphaerales bacterium]